MNNRIKAQQKMIRQYRNEKMILRIRHWLALTSIVLIPALLQAQDQDVQTTWDGLVAIDDAEMAAAYIDPAADFSVFKRVAILQPNVAFRSNWRRDQNRSRTRNVRASDMDRLRDFSGYDWAGWRS